jgi:hypothetical protein
MGDGYRIEDINISESKDEQERLASNPDIYVRMSLAKNEMALPEIQRRLASDASLEVRWALTCNPKLTATVQNILTQDPAYEVRQSLAQVPGLADSVQLMLAYDRDDFVRATLAILPGLTSRVQSKLARDERLEVRSSLATNKLDKDVQLFLSSLDDNEVLEALADNEWIDSSIVATLAKNRDEHIASVAKANLAKRTEPKARSFGVVLG